MRSWGSPMGGGRRRPRLIVQRPSVSICARFACDQPAGTPPPRDRRLLALGKSGPSGLDHGGIDDLPAHGEIAGVPKEGIEPGEQALDGAGPGQLLAVQPDRLRVRHPVLERQTDEAHERQPVLQLVLGLVVRERIERLQHQDLEHQHRVVRRPAALGPVRAIERRVQLRS